MAYGTLRYMASRIEPATIAEVASEIVRAQTRAKFQIESIRKQDDVPEHIREIAIALVIAGSMVTGDEKTFKTPQRAMEIAAGMLSEFR